MVPLLLWCRNGRPSFRQEFPACLLAQRQQQQGILGKERTRNATDPSRSSLHAHPQWSTLVTVYEMYDAHQKHLWAPRGIHTGPEPLFEISYHHQHANNTEQNLDQVIGKLTFTKSSNGDADLSEHGITHRLSKDSHYKDSLLPSHESSCRCSSARLRGEILLRTFCHDENLYGAIKTLCGMDVAPSKIAYASLLKLCIEKKSFGQVMKVSTHLLQQRTEVDDVLGEQLVIALAKCGAILHAHELIHKLGFKTVHPWNAIIMAYVECVSAMDALYLHEQMQQCGVQPNSYTFVTLFKACGSIPDLQRGQELHFDAHKRGYTSIIFVENALLAMYGKCDAARESEHVFCNMVQHDIVSWNSMLSMYVQLNQGELALLLYRQMLAEGKAAEHRTVVFAIQACTSLVTDITPNDKGDQLGKLAPLQIGQALHADAAKKNMLSQVFVSTALCSFYAKVGLMQQSEVVFGNLSHSDIVSWNAMLSLYIERDEGEKALQLFRQLQEACLNPNELTFVLALKACSTMAEKDRRIHGYQHTSAELPLQIGLAIHADAQGWDFVLNTYFGTSVLSMYSKCGAVLEAEHLFSRMPARDTVSWNVLLSMYIQELQGEKALRLYRQMQEEAVHLDQHTIVAAFQACGILAEITEAALVEGQMIKAMPLEIGQALHAEAHFKDLISHVYVSNTLVSMFGKCGTIMEAENAFAMQQTHDIVSWNSMLTNYIQLGLAGKALQLYKKMREEEILPDQLTFVMLLQACGILAEKEDSQFITIYSNKHLACKIGQALHEDICRMGYASDVQVANTLISLYGKCGRIHDAELVFISSPWHGVVAWTAMLSAYVEQGQGELALQMYSRMNAEGTSPNGLTYFMALQACGILADKEEACSGEGRSLKSVSLRVGEALHTEVVVTGYDSELHMDVHLVTMYGKCGATLEAEDIFQTSSHACVNLWNAILSVYASRGQEEDAVYLYLARRTEITIMDDVTYLTILQACGETGRLEICNEIHFHLVSAGYDLMPSMVATIIHTYGSCASMLEVDALFDVLSSPDVVSLTACISSQTAETNLTASEHVLETVRLIGMKPDAVLFTSIISSCSHTGLVAEGLGYFLSMNQDYCIAATQRHITTMLDLLGRAGDFKKVVDILKGIWMRDDLSFWLSLLGACKLHGNMNLAKQMFNHAVKLHPEQAASYVIMSNLYAQAEFQARVIPTKG